VKRLALIALALTVFLSVSATAAAGTTRDKSHNVPRATKFVHKTRGYAEVAGPYRGFTFYSELGAKLRSITAHSKDRVKMSVAGESVGGHKLWRLTVTWPMSHEAWHINNDYRALLISNPNKAKAMLTQKFRVPDFKGIVRGSQVIRPVAMINCSIHGGETTGVDAGLLILRRLAFKNDPKTVRWLKNTIVVIDPCQNPDGRIAGTRGNANGFDCNRDFITLTQPEDVITAATERMWMPNTMIDFHTSQNPTLIEPTTIPHNPNMEWDLVYSVEIPLGVAMGEAVHDELGQDYQIPYFWGTAEDRLGKSNEGWDDYGPYYTPQLCQEYGSASFTHEANYASTWDGVLVQNTTGQTMIDWTSQRGPMLLNEQSDWAQRGFNSFNDGRPWQGNMPDMLRASIFNPITATSTIQNIAYGQPGFPYNNTIGNIQFPFAYIVPVDAANQRNVLAAYKVINHALWYGITVLQAKQPFMSGTTTYPAGTFIVPMNQTLRGLANNLFWDGEDVKAKYGVSSMYDISAWSLKYAYGIDAPAAMTAFKMPKTSVVEPLSPKTKINNSSDFDGPVGLDPVPEAIQPSGSVSPAHTVYWWAGNSIPAARMANQSLKFGFSTGMVTRQIAAPYDNIPLGAFVIDLSSKPWAIGLINQYAQDLGINFNGADGLQMAQLSQLATPNVVYNSDANSAFVIQQMLGFTTVTNNTAANLTASNDFYYSTSSGDTVTAINTWLANSTANRVRTYFVAQSANNQANFTSFWGTKATYTISAIMAGPTTTQITTTAPTTLATGDFVALSGTDSTPTINRTYKITVIDASNFTIPFGTTGNGTTGTVTQPYVAVAVDRSSADNGFMRTEYAQNDALTATYPVDGVSFSYPPYWYHVASGGTIVPTVDATFRAGVVGAFLQGFWNYPSPEAVDSPALMDTAGTLGSSVGRVAMSGFNPTYRGYQDNTAVLLARAMFLSRSTPPTMP
jgi:Zinc carboxypeptidase